MVEPQFFYPRLVWKFYTLNEKKSGASGKEEAKKMTS